MEQKIENAVRNAAKTFQTLKVATARLSKANETMDVIKTAREMSAESDVVQRLNELRQKVISDVPEGERVQAAKDWAGLRSDLDRLRAKLDQEEHKAKCELGTATSLHDKAEEEYNLARQILVDLIPEVDMDGTDKKPAAGTLLMDVALLPDRDLVSVLVF